MAIDRETREKREADLMGRGWDPSDIEEMWHGSGVTCVRVKVGQLGTTVTMRYAGNGWYAETCKTLGGQEVPLYDEFVYQRAALEASLPGGIR